MKKLVLGELELELKSSVFTIIDYKRTFKSDLFADLNSFKEVNNLDDLTILVEKLTQIVYIMAKDSLDNNIKNYDDFLKNIPLSDLFDTDNISEIVQVISESLVVNTTKGVSSNTRDKSRG